MDSTYTNTDTLRKAFSDYLRNKKLRNTAERDAIFTAVCQTKDPFTIETIRQQLENTNFHVSRASVYNTIELLLDAKIVVRHQFTSAIVQYELKDIAEQHNHVICTHCGTVSKIKNDKLSVFLADYKIPKFTPEYYSLYFYGVCSKCKFRMTQEKAQRNKKTKTKY
ncbi:MAG: transcriptional repressor [Tannerella sp.]|jgi:Fur family ferric uptake transcriptional regulator|nr:transcriptional repressor [Tannerella sp.]